MQEKSYQELSFRELAQRVVEFGDMQAFACLNSKVADCNNTNDCLSGLECLMLYYVYYIWMPEDLRKDSQIIKEYLTTEEMDIWNELLKDNSLIENPSEYTDIYQSFIYDLVQDISFRHTNGEIGKTRDVSKFVFPILYKLNEMNYQKITDYCLKILFIGACLYRNEMFGSNLERNAFFSFIFKKKILLHLEESEPTDNSLADENIENAALELNLV